jgi:hypothetical protein
MPTWRRGAPHGDADQRDGSDANEKQDDSERFHCAVLLCPNKLETVRRVLVCPVPDSFQNRPPQFCKTGNSRLRSCLILAGMEVALYLGPDVLKNRLNCPTELKTLAEAMPWLAKEIRKSEHKMEKVQTAVHLVTRAAEHGGPMIFAQMGMLQAIHRHRERGIQSRSQRAPLGRTEAEKRRMTVRSGTNAARNSVRSGRPVGFVSRGRTARYPALVHRAHRL